MDFQENSLEEKGQRFSKGLFHLTHLPSWKRNALFAAPAATGPSLGRLTLRELAPRMTEKKERRSLDPGSFRAKLAQTASIQIAFL